MPLDRRGAVAHVAAALPLGGRGREQHLFGAKPAQQKLMPGAALAVPHHARDLGLVHRIDHGRGRTGAAEHVANIHHVGDAGALTAELARNRNAHEARGARGGDRLRRKPGIAVNRRGMFCGDRRDLLGAGREIRRAGRLCQAAGGELAARQILLGRNALQRRGSQIH